MNENSPADFVRLVAGNLLAGAPALQERATAELLQSLADSWEQQPATVRKRAVAVASALVRGMP
ncbi:hypothetical protein [Streptomyces sp. ZSW22]|uniref:hypothetical protein n=1 Tax=Streptomyces sp. ZSW22 TaxID=3055050 RepID=UPI0025AF18E7|nr:hypothetical protein [Streptomyces sp. ZSW22]MDN3244130.1 hypothetical protein [Streptomyces sp. ZSW22]